MTQEKLIPTRRPVPESPFGGRLHGTYFLDLEVIDVHDPAPHIRVLTVGSSDLVGFEYTPGQDLMIEFEAGERQVRRRYTIRRAEPASGLAELEFELHHGEGVAARWAAHAEIGSRLNAIGPRGTVALRTDVVSHVFVADDSAMPAAFAMLEVLPPHASAVAFFVTGDGPLSRPGLIGVAGTREVWVDVTELPAAIAEMDLSLRSPVAAYVNGGRRLVRLASELLVAAGIEKGDIATKAYWRDDQPNAAHGEPSRD